MAPRSFAWQVCHFQHLGLDSRGRRGTFCTSIDVSGRARFAWQAWYFLHLHRRPRKLGDILGLMWRRGLWRGRRVTFNTSGSICVVGVVLSVPHRCQRKLGDMLGLMWRRGLLRGRRVTFNTSGSIRVAGVILSVPP